MNRIGINPPSCSERQKFVANQQRLGNDRPKLVCIDLQAYATTQAPEWEDIRPVPRHLRLRGGHHATNRFDGHSGQSGPSGPFSVGSIGWPSSG